MMTVKEISELTGISARTLHYYVKKCWWQRKNVCARHSRKITTVLRAGGMTGNAHTSNHCPYARQMMIERNKV